MVGRRQLLCFGFWPSAMLLVSRKTNIGGWKTILLFLFGLLFLNYCLKSSSSTRNYRQGFPGILVSKQIGDWWFDYLLNGCTVHPSPYPYHPCMVYLPYIWFDLYGYRFIYLYLHHTWMLPFWAYIYRVVGKPKSTFRLRLQISLGCPAGT